MANSPGKQWEVVDDGTDSYRNEGAKRFNRAERIRWLARLLDSQFNFLGIRIGWDAILGLIPGVGDIATNLAGFFILIEASNLGAPPSVILRMGLNLIIDNVLDTVPLLGNIFDIFWRANTRNVALLERYMENPRRTVLRSRMVVVFTLVMVAAVSIACVALAIFAVAAILQWLTAGFRTW